MCPLQPEHRCHRGHVGLLISHHVYRGVETVGFYKLRKEKAPPNKLNVKCPDDGHLEENNNTSVGEQVAACVEPGTVPSLPAKGAILSGQLP